MKLYILVAMVFSSQLILGAEYVSSTFVSLTNELSRVIQKGDWYCTTNENGVVERIGLGISVGKAFSDEIVNSLCIICPKEWQEASASSGNMHNPKMLLLRPYFNKAVFFTPTVQRFEAFVNERIGRDVHIDICHEKLEYIENDRTRTRKVNCILSVVIWRGREPTTIKSKSGRQSKGEKSMVADKIVSALPSTFTLIRIIGEKYEKRKILNGETICALVKDGVVECTLKDELDYGVKRGTGVQVINPTGNLKDKQPTAPNGKEAVEAVFKDPIYVFADINHCGRNVIAMRNDGTLLLGSVITIGQLTSDELSCGVNISESDIIDTFRRRLLNNQILNRSIP